MFDSKKPAKEVMNSISDLYDRSIPKEEIFIQIKEKFPQLSDEIIARGVSSFIVEETKKKNIIHTRLLSVLLLISLFLIAVTPPLYYPGLNVIITWSFRFLLVLLAALFIRGFLRFDLYYFSSAVSFYAVFAVLLLFNLFTNQFSTLLLFSAAAAFLILLYLYLLRMELFPNINFWGSVTKERGVYKF